ncbi:hypothetical protein N6H14_32690 [Paenibacillus sp. CC-CFT747]|nr:hypothetical protein N6H14_32690 [Paenibacillus sp. CC-CFT747]
MKWTEQELSHLVVLADMVRNSRKTAVMEDMVECLLYVAKAVREVELPVPVGERMGLLIGRIEDRLRLENDLSRPEALWPRASEGLSGSGS